jgi:hypothetical protein
LNRGGWVAKTAVTLTSSQQEQAINITTSNATAYTN